MDIKELLAQMAARRASDLFITADWPPSLKLDGKIHCLGKTPVSAAQARELVVGVMNEKQRAEFEATNECQFAFNVVGIGRFRASAFVQRDMAGMVLRRIESRIPTLEELNLPPSIRELGMSRCGLVLFVGANGAGKSTSLAALVGYRNANSSGHIITIEDPIEFIHQHGGCIVTQREVGMDTESLETALHHSVRQAPDVIMIGEIRSGAALEETIAFAESGHLVMSTLHAPNASQAIDRMLNLYPDAIRSQVLADLALNLRGIVSQQLIPTADGRGRVPAFEILINTPLVADIIRRGELDRLKELMGRSVEQGMSTFDHSVFELYRAGRISLESALHHADSANEVRLMIKLSGTANRSPPAPDPR